MFLIPSVEDTAEKLKVVAVVRNKYHFTFSHFFLQGLETKIVAKLFILVSMGVCFTQKMSLFSPTP